ANGNIIIYKDGELLLKKNRFNADGSYDDKTPANVIMDEDWYEAISDGTLYIGALGDNSGCVVGGIADFCIYDCSMSYYDVKAIQNEQDIEAGLVTPQPLNSDSLGTAIPSWTNSTTSQMSGLAGTAFDNILYSPQVTGMPSGATSSSNPSTTASAAAFSDDGVHFAVYYANNTVIYMDGKTTPKIPVYAAGRNGEQNRDGDMLQVYPIVHQLNDTSDCKIFSLVDRWKGWHSSSEYHNTINNPDNITTGHNSTTSGNCDLQNSDGWTGSQSDRKIQYIANVLQLNENQVSINSDGYQKVNLSWHFTYNWEKYSSFKWQGWETRTKDLYSSHDIWIIDLRDIVAIKEDIVAEYDSIVTSDVICPATIENYKAIVEEIMNFDPQAFNYAGGTEAAVKACYAASQKLVDDYANAKAAVEDGGKHNIITLDSREPACAYPGLTEGSYCEYCGAIIAEQTVTEKLPHTFGNQFTDNGVDYYVQCSVCGLKLLVKQNEVRYENLFSLDKWFATDSKTPNSGTITVDFVKDTITFVNGSTTTESVSAASGNVSRSYNHYAFPVDPATTYVLEYALTSQDATSDIFIFYYDNNGNHVGTYGGVVSGTNGASQVYNYAFTPVANAAFAELRFDSNDPGETVRFSNIGVYTQDSYNTLAKENPYSRLGFNTGESIELFTPKRIGYEFLGWYTSSGMKVSNTNQLDMSATVYAKWREVGNSVLYNGNLFSLTEYAKTNDYNMVGNAFDGHVWVDFENATLNTLSPREGLGKASLAVNSQLDVYNTPGTYKVPVTAGKEYVYTATHASRSAYQTYLWFYNASGGAVNHPATGAQWINHGTNNPDNGCVAQWYENTLVIRFTVPEGATHMSFRMGTTGKYAFTQTFSNIGLYAAEDYDNFVGGFVMPTQTYVPDGEN
ncbi:MAG: hypothetical protein IJO14_01815, partial [Clostridia bacterium]|nr:hypothetical protein [Clostridia bacterium]